VNLLGPQKAPDRTETVHRVAFQFRNW